MSQTKQERNKALVLEAFDTLFNKRDYVAAERYWSPNYIQHSAHIAPGREGLFNLIKGMPPTLKYEPGAIVAGRRKGHLTEVASANPRMRWVELDIADPASISAVAGRLIAEHPKLNVLINNAGVMHIDDASAAIDEKLLVSTLTTNVMGP